MPPLSARWTCRLERSDYRTIAIQCDVPSVAQIVLAAAIPRWSSVLDVAFRT